MNTGYVHKSALILIRHEVEEWNGDPWTVHVLPELLWHAWI